LDPQPQSKSSTPTNQPQLVIFLILFFLFRLFFGKWMLGWISIWAKWHLFAHGMSQRSCKLEVGCDHKNSVNLI
jgi:hypothetical protein